MKKIESTFEIKECGSGGFFGIETRPKLGSFNTYHNYWGLGEMDCLLDPKGKIAEALEGERKNIALLEKALERIMYGNE